MATLIHMDPSELARLLLSGQSVFLTGAAGSGKTFLTNAALDLVQESKKANIVRCGTTGVSALLHKNGMTVHSAFKLPVTDHPKTFAQWIQRVKLRVQKGDAYIAPLQAKSLIVLIDEISMLSAYLLELLDMECRVIRKTPKVPFGGITLLIVGDFTQLPPVFNYNSVPKPPQRSELFAFESPVWYALKLKTVLLAKNHRQQDMFFSALIHQLKEGRPLSEAQRELLRTKNSTVVPPDALCVMIRRDAVNAYNKKRLDELEVPVHSIKFPQKLSYSASGREMSIHLQKDVEQNLYLNYGDKEQMFKTGVRVMLVTNLASFGYVNGDRGMIIGWAKRNVATLSAYHGEMSEDGECPVVLFERTQAKTLVCYHTFERKMEYSDKNQAAALSCIPLCLAEASTVHKLQGSSISSPLHIVCDGMNRMAATFYVAISRGTDLNNITFQNFSHEGELCKKALDFYRNEYRPKDQRIIDYIDKTLTEEMAVSVDEEVARTLGESLGKASNKRKFVDAVARWVDEQK